jgi:hypothetical protein
MSKDESVDLVYLDPPFNSDANYNVLFRSPSGDKSHAQIEAFEDTCIGKQERRKKHTIKYCTAAIATYPNC